MSSWDFPTNDPVDLQVRAATGDVTVSAVATQTARVTLEGDEGFITGARVEFDDGKLSVVGTGLPGLRGLGLTVTAELPEGSSCLVHTTSADVRCSGRLGALDVHTCLLYTSVRAICERSGAYEIRAAHDAAERAAIWTGRKSAFAAVGRISPAYIVQDRCV